jgi:hypothetical protein
MKFVIRGKEYDVVAGLEKATLQTLYVLKVRQGIGMKSLMEQAKKMEKIKDPLDLLEDENTFQVLMAVIWLARKHAGENLTFEEANEFGISELEVVDEDDDEPEVLAAEADPKASPDSAPAALPPTVTAPVTT